MLIHADFSKFVAIRPDQYQWVASPQAGVDRVMLDRIGAEQARATSLVRYAKAASFPQHEHPKGEEILVLSGVFSEHGIDYPAGYYLRNPEGSSHQPSTQEGTLVFVKLRQMSDDDRQSLRINTHDADHWQQQTDTEGQTQHFCPLFCNDNEQVELRQLAPQQILRSDPKQLTEILVISGSLSSDQAQYPQGSWLRIPKGAKHSFRANSDLVKVYIKRMKNITNINI